MAIFILGLVLFLGIHTVRMAAPGFRDAQIRARGEGPWKGIYSIVSLAGLVAIVWGYSMAQPLAPVLYVPPFWLVHLVVLLMVFSFIALFVSVLPGGRLKAMLKHPMLLAVKIWATAHLLVNGDLVSVILFVAFLAWAVAVRISLKRRNAPVAAPGPVRNDIVAVVVGLAAWAAFMFWLHEWLIGVPIPMGA